MGQNSGCNPARENDNAQLLSSADPLYTRAMSVLNHLLEFDDADFIEIDEMDTPALLGAQANTAADILSRLGSPEHLLAPDQAQAARNAFAATMNTSLTDADKKKAVLALRVPEAVKHLAGMLSQFDWDYVEQAKELRGYVVANLLEESRHKDARIRLKSLELIGKLTEVASFSERIEIVKKDASSEELEARIRARLASFLPKTVEVETVQPK